MSTASTSANASDGSLRPAPPQYIVVDTNVLLRLLILDFGTKEAIGIPSLAKKAGALIVLAPGQEDEFWRNASAVLSEHVKRWTQIAQDTRKAIGDLVSNLKAASALGILDDAQEKVLTELGPTKQLLERVKERKVLWTEFEAFAEKNFNVLRNMTEQASCNKEEIRTRADHRVAMSNPPCNDKKKRPLGDCLVWELLLILLERNSGECWFATTDEDFSDQGNSHSLNCLLSRDVRITGGKLRFFHEDRALGLSPGGRFKVLTELASTIPQLVTDRMRRELDALSSISPITSLIQGEDAMRQLTYREREIMKLRMGFGDGYEYTQEEVAHIFKVPQARISQIETSAAKKLRKHLSGEP